MRSAHLSSGQELGYKALPKGILPNDFNILASLKDSGIPSRRQVYRLFRHAPTSSRNSLLMDERIVPPTRYSHPKYNRFVRFLRHSGLIDPG